MALSRAGMENELVTALKGKLANRFWQLSVLTNGSNPDLNAPIRRAVLSLGGTLAASDGLTVSDADLAPFSGWDVERLKDTARVEVLKMILGQALDVDVRTDQDEQRLSTITGQIRADIAYLEGELSKPYGLSMPVIASGQMTGPNRAGDIPNDPFRPCSSRSSHRRWPYP